MKKLLFILLVLNTCAFCQYSNNMVSNAGFETATWGSWNIPISSTRVNNPVRTGLWSQRAITTGDGQYEGFYKEAIVVIGKTYRLSGYIYTDGNEAAMWIWQSPSYSASPPVSNMAFTLASFEFNAVTTTLSFGFGANAHNNPMTLYGDDAELRQKLDSLYFSNTGNDASKGDIANPIATIAEGTGRGIYNGGVFAFKSGDSFTGTFTAQNNCTLTVYGGTDPVTISAIDANGYTVTISELINPATDARFPTNPTTNGFPKL